MYTFNIIGPYVSLISLKCKNIIVSSTYISYRGIVQIIPNKYNLSKIKNKKAIETALFYGSKEYQHYPKLDLYNLKCNTITSSIIDCVYITYEYIKELSNSIQGQNEIIFDKFVIGDYANILSNKGE